MEKLINLLNEYDPYIAKDGEYKDNLWGYAYQGYSAVFTKELAESYIISARYGFIKRLVDNDKINRDKVKRESKKNFVGDLEPRTPRYKLLILLSISNTPIADLISYLK